MSDHHHRRLLAQLDREHLAALSEYHTALAGSFSAEAARRPLKVKKKVALSRFDRLRRLGQLAVDLHAAGADLDQAITLIASQHEVTDATVRSHADRLLRDLTDRERQNRDRRIWLRARRGWRNKQIARAEGVSVGTVGRVLKRLKERAALAALEKAQRCALRGPSAGDGAGPSSPSQRPSQPARRRSDGSPS